MHFNLATPLVVCAAAWLVGGCTAGSTTPPFEELPLRDALQAEPYAVASAAGTQTRALADRLEREGDAAHEPQHVEQPGSLTARDAIDAIDAARSDRGEDAWVLVRLQPGATPGSLDAQPFATRDLATRSFEERRPDLPPIEGEAPPAATRELETKALRGHGGDVLRELRAETGARHVVRVVAWPSGVVAFGDSLYVNGAWLVAMGSRDERDAGAASAPALVFVADRTAPVSPSNGDAIGSASGIDAVAAATTVNTSSGQESSAPAGTTAGASPSSGGACSGCSNSCNGCAKSCVGKSCRSNHDCSSQSDWGCNGSGNGCGHGGGSSGCAVAVEGGPGSPLATAVWLLLPALLVAARGRRAAIRARCAA